MTDAPEGPAPPATPSPDPGRRRFLELATACVGACAGAAALSAVGAAVVGTALVDRGDGDAWFDAGPLARLPDGAPVKLALVGEVRDAWQRLPRRTVGNVVVVRRGEQVTALSATCPHNGCDVLVGKQGVVCPCHDTKFSDAGEVKSGPSPRGLDPLEARVEAGRLLVRWRRYAVGTAERRPV